MKGKKTISTILTGFSLLALSVPAQASKTDDRIEASARQSYVFKTYLRSDDIKIHSRHGAVTLTGVVSEGFHKSLAEDTVSGLPGVRSVDDRLVVKSAPAAVNPDLLLRDKVKVTLQFHRSVRANSTEVDVKDGVVILRGQAGSQAQKDLTTEYTKDVEGVVEVRNEMTVVTNSRHPRTAGEKIDDASITAQVKTTLLYHRSTSALNTKVKTTRGVVTLFGKAKSAAELNLATKLANDVSGVKKVNNRMVIE